MTRITKTIVLCAAIILPISIGAVVYFYVLGGGVVDSNGQPRSFIFFPGGGESGSEGVGNESGQPAGADNGTGGPATTRFAQIIKEPAIGATLTQDESKILFYKRAGGNLFSADLNGENQENLSNLTIVGLVDVVWSPDRSMAALSYLEDRTMRRLIETVATTTTVFLPQNAASPVWAPDTSKRIGYIDRGNSGVRFVASDPRGKNIQTLHTSPVPDITALWPEKSTLLFLTPPTYLAPSLSFLLPIGKTAVSYVSARGLGLLPNGLATITAKSSVDANGTLLPLALVNKSGQLIAETRIATVVDKCVWNITGEALYCAVPNNPPGFLPDDWYKGKISFSDHFVTIDSRTGISADVGTDTGQSFDAINLFLDSKNQYLFFINKTDSTLWRLELQ